MHEDMEQSQRMLMLTDDGSHTVAVPGMNVTFHSRHGAIQESRHVFLDAGLSYIRKQYPGESIAILEVGFGTGLNAFLTAIEAINESLDIHYTSLETNPLDMATAALLNYPDQLGSEDLFRRILSCPWNEENVISEHFSLRKTIADLTQYQSETLFHLVYFDAFAPEAQPELWTSEVFAAIGNWMHPGGALVTYCSKSVVRRAMQAAGWTVTKLPGPRGKREMVRALWRPDSR